MASKRKFTKVDVERVSIPLVMLKGNMESLLEHSIPVQSISLKHYGNAGVVLLVSQTPEQKADSVRTGFKTVNIKDAE